jgi:hypothetical protein
MNSNSNDILSHDRINAIERYLHSTTEKFDDWEYDGSTLVIILKNEIIEQYNHDDLCITIKSFEKL